MQTKFVLIFLLFGFKVFTFGQPKSDGIDSVKIAQSFQLAALYDLNFDSVKSANNLLVSNAFTQDVFTYHLCRYFFVKGQPDSVIFYAAAAIQKNNLPRAAKYFNLLGSAYSLKGDYNLAIENMLNAKTIYEHGGDGYRTAVIENNIANVFFSLKEYESAYQFAFSAYSFLSSQGDTIHLPAVTAIAAVSAIKIDSLRQGGELTSQAITMAERYNNPVGQIVANYAKGELLLEKDSIQAAIIAYNFSSELSKIYRQTHYIMLNDIGLLHAYTKVGNYKMAIENGEEALKLAKSQQNDNTLYSIHRQLGAAYAGLKNYERAYQNMARANELYVAYAGIESRSIINEMLVKYETEKKERELAQNEVELLKNEKDITQRNWYILLLVSSLFVMVLLFVFIRRLTKQRVERLKIVQEHKLSKAIFEGELKERTRIAGELHDGVASALTATKIKLELLSDEKSKELSEVLDQMKKTHADVRRISHNLMPVDFDQKSLLQAVKDYCLENSSDRLKIHFSTNEYKEQLSEIQSKILYRIIQELINNVQKHANAHNCFVQFLFNKQELTLSVEDDGIGIDSTELDGKGLTEIRNRFKNMGGQIAIESEVNKGTLVILIVRY